MRAFRRLIICAVSMATLAAASSPAGAATVKYYSRQKLANLSTAPSYTYTPSYGAYGACSGGTQSAPISTCTRSDGTSVATSFCSPASKSQSCSSITCAPLVSGYWNGGSGTPNALAPATTAAAALANCNQAALTYGQNGVCLWYNASGHQNYYVTGGTLSGNQAAQYTGSLCQ